MTRYDKITAVADEQGRIIGLALPHVPARGEPYTKVVALPGQTVAEVALPPELERLESLTEVHDALGRFRLVDGRLRRADDSPRRDGSPNRQRAAPAGARRTPGRKR
jgi:hypothetical protein